MFYSNIALNDLHPILTTVDIFKFYVTTAKNYFHPDQILGAQTKSCFGDQTACNQQNGRNHQPPSLAKKINSSNQPT